MRGRLVTCFLIVIVLGGTLANVSCSSKSVVSQETRQREEERMHTMFIACEYLRCNDPDIRESGITLLASMRDMVPYTMLKLQWYAETDPENQRLILKALVDSGELALGYFAGYEDEMLDWCRRTDSEEMKRRAADVERIVKLRQPSVKK